GDVDDALQREEHVGCVKIVDPRLFWIRAVQPGAVRLLVVDDVTSRAIGEIDQLGPAWLRTNTREHFSGEETRVEDAGVCFGRIAEAKLGFCLNCPRQVFYDELAYTSRFIIFPGFDQRPCGECSWNDRRRV